MTTEMKNRLFEEMLRLEHLSEKKTYDGHDYGEQSEGAWGILSILGLASEYIEWAIGK